MKQKIVFALLMGVITTGIVSFTLIGANLGFSPSFARTWVKAWGTAYVVVIPIILFVSPRVQLLVNKLFKIDEFNQEKP